ncbi:MAG: hypothetical protein RL391_1548 [Actinomycetota bacterium]|jgi:hypothetical protein
MKRWALALAAGSLLLGACSSGSDSGSEGDGGLKGAATTIGRQIGANVGVPSNLASFVKFNPVPPVPTAKKTPNMTDPTKSTVTFLAFGDSYGSGEGNPAVPGNFNGDGKSTGPGPIWVQGLSTGAQPNTDERCHRSSESGSAKAYKRLKASYPTYTINYASFACSGAETQHIIDTFYEGAKNPNSNAPKDIKPQIQQASDFVASIGLKDPDVDVIYVSIGGNNAGFAEVVKDCFIIPGSCETSGSTSSKNLATKVPKVAGEITRVANALKSKFINARIFFSGYPDPLSVAKGGPGDKNNDGICSQDDDQGRVSFSSDDMWDIETAEAVFLRDRFLPGLNGAISSGVSAAGSNVNFIDSHVANRSGNNGFCSATPIIRFNDDALTKQGRDNDLSSILDYSKGGWHPNDFGYQRYADAIVNAVTSKSPKFSQGAEVAKWTAAPLAVVDSSGSSPTSIWVTSLTSGGVFNLEWNDMSNNEDYFEMLVTSAATNAQAQTIQIPAETTSYKFSGTPGSYTFSIRACHKHVAGGAATCSAWSSTFVNNAKLTTAPGGVTCGADSNFGSGPFGGCAATFTVPAGTPLSSVSYAYIELKDAAGAVRGAALVQPGGGRVIVAPVQSDPIGGTISLKASVLLCSLVDGGTCVAGPISDVSMTRVADTAGKVLLPVRVPQSNVPPIPMPVLDAGMPRPSLGFPGFDNGKQCMANACR